ncbi:MAG: XdhC family protein [Pyrinomonadaceae bacterium]|nr:XdhC family protein [Acidobacteriota bacterium]MBP7376370.1 XdhC family protein [Pyrinomonadaceae bacterium]
MKEIAEILRVVTRFTDGDKAILATVIDVKGSGYRLPGARMLMLADGQTVGTVSGGCLEADVLERGKKVLASGEAEIFTYDTTGNEDSVFSLNMGCGGVIDIRLEPIGKFSPVIGKMRVAYEDRISNDEFEIPLAVKLFGAGADAIPFVRIGTELGWQITVHDHRHAFLTTERFPTAQMLVHQTACDVLSDLETDDRTAIVIMTHNYARDRYILPPALNSDAFYIGALGPKRRTEQLLEEIGGSFSPEQLARLYAPAGLDIGADTPEGIALSIIGEIQTVLANRNGGHLRNRQGSIYDRK